MKKFLAVICTGSLVLTLAACGGNQAPSQPPAESPAETAEASMEETPEASAEAPASEAAAAPDFSNPTIVIETGDTEGIKDFASKMQSFEIAENTVIKITGEWSKPGSTPSVNERSADGSESWGVQMFFDYTQEDLSDGTPIEVVGYAKPGDYFCEFHVAEGNLKVLE